MLTQERFSINNLSFEAKMQYNLNYEEIHKIHSDTKVKKFISNQKYCNLHNVNNLIFKYILLFKLKVKINFFFSLIRSLNI